MNKHSKKSRLQKKFINKKKIKNYYHSKNSSKSKIHKIIEIFELIYKRKKKIPIIRNKLIMISIMI